MRRASHVTGFAVGLAFVVLAQVAVAEFGIDHRDEDAVSLGAEVYTAHCASCHGDKLEGQTNWQVRDADGYLPAPPHDPSGHTWHHPDAQLFAITKYGTETIVGGDYRSNMIGFGDVLTDDEIWAVLAFIKSTWPPRVISIHDEINAAYEAAK